MQEHRFIKIAGLGLLLAACEAGRTGGPVPRAVASEAKPAAPPATTAADTSTPATEPAPSASVRDFDDDAANTPPRGFLFGRTGKGPQGRWIVRAEAGAPSGANVLAQLDADDTNFRFPIAVMDEPSLRDTRVSVRCKAISGRVDQACGLVARYRDENTYYVTRANVLEDNVRLYVVRDGKRDELASWDGKVTPNAWHELRLDVRGDHLEVHWDGQRVLDHHDSSLPQAGRTGLWTKADSVTYFDDLRVEALR